jgi:hypothetical protein
MKIESMFGISIFERKCIYLRRNGCLAPEQSYARCRGCVHFNFHRFVFKVYFKIINFAKKVAMRASKSLTFFT